MRLETLTAGMPIVYGGDRIAVVDDALAAAFTAGDRLVVVQTTGDLLHIPAAVHATVTSAVDAAVAAFEAMGSIGDEQITEFFEVFANRMEDDRSFEPIAAANDGDVAAARQRGRSVTRLILSPQMRAEMVDGLRGWARAPSGRNVVVDTVEHPGWRVDLVQAGLGVVGFVFEGRPNVFADGAGVLRSGNTMALRIGSDALGTAQAIVAHALDPALAASGLPAGAVSLVPSRERSAGWALFSDPRLALAVARGSGPAVAQLGAVARQAGLPVSLHGTGGAWVVASENADPQVFSTVVVASLDRKVCNTLNTCCVVASAAAELVPRFLDALDEAGRRRGTVAKLHVAEGSEGEVPESWFVPTEIHRAGGPVEEPRTEILPGDRLGQEWEWEDTPEVSLVVVPDVATAVDLFNQQSPRFVASLVSSDEAEQQRFFDTIDAPFVGNGFTRWVDGQYALNKPELGLANWQSGRLFGRGGILSGDSVYTVRTRVTQTDLSVAR
ncbi:MAG: aldehyde dehydrogenase family protein [Acidimicrobiia bacterium]|nr:aldehyde dehydrogenase family protein [Acidimicrobiia bacterium]